MCITDCSDHTPEQKKNVDMFKQLIANKLKEGTAVRSNEVVESEEEEAPNNG